MLENATERLVADEIEKRKAPPHADSTLCWCSLCENDVMALSLMSISPRYETRFISATATGIEIELIREAVSSALSRVSLHPRHERYPATSGVVELRLVNFSREAGASLVNALPAEDGKNTFCVCARCRADTLAYALNRFPPRYGLERNGSVEFPAKERDAIRAEMSSFIAYAARVVADNPRHSSA